MCTHTWQLLPRGREETIRLWTCFREAVLDPVLKVECARRDRIGRQQARVAISVQALHVQKGRCGFITQGLGHLEKA